MRVGLAMLIALFLSACQTVAPLEFVRAEPLVVYNQADIRAKVTQFAHMRAMTGQVADLSRSSFFNAGRTGDEWRRKGRNRILVQGYPESCAIPNYRWNHRDSAGAYKKSLSSCLERMKAFSEQTGQKCGCQLVAYNNKLFVEPLSLRSRAHIPVIALVKDEKGRREIAGYSVSAGKMGRNLPISIYADKGKLMCKGTYDQLSKQFSGKARLSCFDGKIKGEVVYNTGGAIDGRSYGTGLMKAGENEMLFVYGLDQKTFHKHRAEVLGQ